VALSALDPSAATRGGAGTDPVGRVTAALRAIVDFKLANSTLTRALENAGAGSPYDNESYGILHARLAGVVAEARGHENADYLAHALLAAVRSDLLHQLRDWPRARLDAGLSILVTALLAKTGPTT
jgi:hypothetical protein